MENGETRTENGSENCQKTEESVENNENESSALNTNFEVDRACIPTVSKDEQEKELSSLDIQIYQQDVLEKEILNQVDKALEIQKQKKAEELALKNEKKLKKQVKTKKAIVEKRKNEPEEKEKEEREEKQPEPESVDLSLLAPEETEMERKIRMGEMTPFGTVVSLKTIEGNNLDNVEEYLKQQIEKTKAHKVLKRKRKIKHPKKLNEANDSILKKKEFFPKKKRKKEVLGTQTSEEVCDMQQSPGELKSERTAMDDSSGSEYIPDEIDDNDDPDFELKPKVCGNKKKTKKQDEQIVSSEEEYSDEEICASVKARGKKEIDDGDEYTYLARMEDWDKNPLQEELETKFRSLSDGFKMPVVIWNKLYNYQRVGVQWLWELALQRCGGILGDEMGLGKTIQVISFLAGLSVSKLISRYGCFKGLGPVLIVCPTTVMHQWVREIHQWWPRFRAALLHESGSFRGKRQSLIRDIVKSNGILITSYISCIQQSEDLLRYTWHYIILDEGHKIRNPESQIASTVKLFRTPHRLILSGSPMQNNLKELWSLFDFIFPGKLGTLPVFLAEFAVPITQGGYANASKVQVATAYKCATVLRDTISPYLLRRVKDDVKSHINLPPKNEQVLFCRLTDEQKELYVSYLNGGRVDDILSGRLKIFVGLIEMRKICNHPDLFTGGPKLYKWEDPNSLSEENRFGYWKKAGKMIVVETLLKIWKKQGHRVLIFTQSRQMLRILEAFVQSQNYEYIKIDGSTNIGSRQPLINKFNEDKKYYIFLSTTHVGGLGVNLTGANRVVIYDPDWNPATDTQARERAWRIGQENQVTIYRLVTSGTIEEKIYHRQIFKQFLTNKVLKDPSQKRFFKSNDLYELFTYKDSSGGNETSAIFAGTNAEVNLKQLSHRQKIKKIKEKMRISKSSVKEDADARKLLTDKKIEKMKKMAQALSKKIAQEAMGIKNAPNDACASEPVAKKSNTEEKNEITPIIETSTDDSKYEKEEKRKKHKSKRKDAVFDGEVVPFLKKQKQYRDVIKEITDNEANDDYILKKLLTKTGVQSALQHDQIMEERTADYDLVEGEAEKVAKEAVRALKESRKHYAGFFENSQSNKTSPLRFGKKTFSQRSTLNTAQNDGDEKPMTSAELLQRIRQRNGLCPIKSSSTEDSVNDHSELLTDIRNFISFGGERESQATTQEIVDRFKDRLPAGQTPIFKALLNEICEFHRSSNGEGVWELRSEFRCKVNAMKTNKVKKESATFSSESQVGECQSFWLLSGPPFDQRDYMISPSESASGLFNEKSSASGKKGKLRPCDIKIDSKYLFSSKQALIKILDLLKEECNEYLVNRLRDLIYKFLQDTPVGFFVDDLPLLIEIVEHFARNHLSVPEFEEFIKTIMGFAKSPPLMGKSSDAFYCKEAIIDYFTLYGELLATFFDECFQLRLLEILDCLLMRRELVDLSCIKLSLCHEGMEDSQLPVAVAALMETVSANLYIHYLELALQMVLVSLKAGYVMIQNNVLHVVLCRLDAFFSNDSKNSSELFVGDEENDDQQHAYYKLLDKSGYLIWAVLNIISKYKLVLPCPGEKALWTLKCVFIREARKDTKKSIDTRNNLAGILVKLCSIFKEKLPLAPTGLAEDMARFAVATEIKNECSHSDDIKLGASKEDYSLKKLMLLGCCFMAENSTSLESLKSQQVVEGVLRLISKRKPTPWIFSQFETLFQMSLRVLSEIVPTLPEVFVRNKGNNRLLSVIQWLMNKPFDQDLLLDALKTLSVIVTCTNSKCIIEGLKIQNSIKQILDLCVFILNFDSIKIKHQEQLLRIFIILERLFKNNPASQENCPESFVTVSVNFFKRVLADLDNDSKWNSTLFVAFGGFLWEAVAWCPERLKMFLEKGGVFLMLDFIQMNCFPVQMIFLGILVDMTDEGDTIGHLLSWRGKDGYGVLNMLIEIWRKEENMNKVHRSKNGLIQDVETPLMTEEQWFLTHQVKDSHIYSPSIAEMVCSARPKIHALYQNLQRRYSTLTKIGESSYGLQLKTVKSSLQVYIPLIEHFLALKMGEIWFEVVRDANISGVIPTSFDGELLCTLIDEKNKWASRIKTMQEEILLLQQGDDFNEEKNLYKFLKSCRLCPSLEALNELDYITRSSFQIFQKKKKEKQIEEVENSLASLPLSVENIHRTYMFKTNATWMRNEYVFVKSEKEIQKNPDEILPVSSESSEDNVFEYSDEI